jgi:hypothetical protein
MVWYPREMKKTNVSGVYPSSAGGGLSPSPPPADEGYTPETFVLFISLGFSPPPADEGYTPETFVLFISLGYQTILPPGSLFFVILDPAVTVFRRFKEPHDVNKTTE